MNAPWEEIFCSRVVVIDSEFNAWKGRGRRPGSPWCFCAIEFLPDGRAIEHRLRAPYPVKPPWERGDSYLTVGFALGAEAGSMMNIGWPFPLPAIDLWAEYMTIHNSEMTKKAVGDGEGRAPIKLIQACRRYRVPTMSEAAKESLRALAHTKEHLTPEEITTLEVYCLDDDCWATARLFAAMRPFIDLARAPIRGAYMMETERIRWHGMPIDVEKYNQTKRQAPAIRAKMRTELNRKLGAEVYYCGVFKRKVMLALMRRHRIPIPIDPKTGNESLKGKHIKSMIETYPILKHYYEDTRMIDALGDLQLEISPDDNRARCWLFPFGQKTGRNNPSTNRYLWGLPHTLRSYLKPEEGMAIAQVDVKTEEVGIAAANSRDPQLIEDYQDDVYRRFAKASLGIENPTKRERQVYKATVLARMYGQGIASLARDLGITRAQAEHIDDQMTARYPVLNAWLNRVCVKAAHFMPITSVLGWSLTASGKPGEERTFRNFLMQSGGAEYLRVVIVRAGAAGLKLIGCAHDSFLVEDTIDNIEQSVAKLQEIMRQTSRDLFNGFELRAECDPEKDITRYPDRFVDEREREDGMVHWNWLMKLVEEEENAQGGWTGDHRSDPDREFVATDEPVKATGTHD